MYVLIAKMFGIAIGLILIVYLVANAFRNGRRLDTRIREFKAEQKSLRESGGPVNPYAELAELYKEQDQSSTQRSQRKR